MCQPAVFKQTHVVCEIGWKGKLTQSLVLRGDA